MSNTLRNRNIVMTAMFGAIIFILAFTPIGFINLGIARATTVHIPVILGSILLGPKVGAILGFLFGLTSLITNTMLPVPLSFVFSPLIPVPGTDSGTPLALIVCFLPRILAGVVPYFVYKFFQTGLKKYPKLSQLSLPVAGLAGSMTNTLLVLHLLYFFFKDSYAAINNVSADVVYGLIMAIITSNGIIEAIVSMIIVFGLGKVLIKKV